MFMFFLDSSKFRNFVYEPFYVGKGTGKRFRNTVKDKVFYLNPKRFLK